jgi:hypothetical protein
MMEYFNMANLKGLELGYNVNKMLINFVMDNLGLDLVLMLLKLMKMLSFINKV